MEIEIINQNKYTKCQDMQLIYVFIISKYYVTHRDKVYQSLFQSQYLLMLHVSLVVIVFGYFRGLFIFLRFRLSTHKTHFFLFGHAILIIL